MEKYTKKQIFVFSIVFLFLLTLFAYAGTVTKNYTFSTGDVVSADKINANFDTLYTLVNGKLDDNNVDNLSASKIKTGVFDKERIPKPANSVVFFDSKEFSGGNLGGRTGADAICLSSIDNESISMFNNSCNSVRAFISVDSNDEIRDIPSNYSVPTNVPLRGLNGWKFAENWGKLFASTTTELKEQFFRPPAPNLFGSTNLAYWSGSNWNGSVTSTTCNAWTSSVTSVKGTLGQKSSDKEPIDVFMGTGYEPGYPCDRSIVNIMCICY